MVNKRHTQYGGGEGGIQRLPGGKSKPLTPSEEARVIRMKGVRAGVLGLDQMATADSPIVVPSEAGPVESARTADMSDAERERRAYRKAEQARLDKNANKYNREVD